MSRVRNYLIVTLGSLIYWAFGLLLRRAFQNLSELFQFLEILLAASVAPLILGLMVSLILKNNKGWIYGARCYMLYFIWVFIIGLIFELQFQEFTEHLLNMIKAYLYIGSVATLFAAFGGFLGDIRRRRLS